MPNTTTKKKKTRTQPTTTDRSRRATARRHRAMEKYLNAGINATEVAPKVGLTPRAVFEFARNNKLPTNPTVKPNSPQERQICENLFAAGYTQNPEKAINAVAILRNHAPASIRNIIKRVEKRKLKASTV